MKADPWPTRRCWDHSVSETREFTGPIRSRAAGTPLFVHAGMNGVATTCQLSVRYGAEKRIYTGDSVTSVVSFPP